jgi:hypothetical protein
VQHEGLLLLLIECLLSVWTSTAAGMCGAVGSFCCCCCCSGLILYIIYRLLHYNNQLIHLSRLDKNEKLRGVISLLLL